MKTAWIAAISLAGAVVMPAQAQTVDQKGAGALISTLERYLDARVLAGVGLSIKPAGDAYALTLDAADEFIAGGRSVEPLRLTPRRGGTWGLTGKGDFHLRTPKETSVADAFALTANGCRLDGEFDPAIRFFTRLTAACDGAEASYLEDGGRVTMTMEGVGFRIEGRPEPGGRASVILRLDIAGVREDRQIAGVAVLATYAPQFVELSLTRSSLPKLIDLLPHFTNAPESATLLARQEDIRTAVRAALPIADDWLFRSENGRMTFESSKVGIAVGRYITSMGPAGQADKDVVTRVSASEIALFGRFALGDGPALAEPPSWAKKLTPSAFDMEITVGWPHARKLVGLVVDNFDAGRDPPVGEPASETFVKQLVATPPILEFGPVVLRNEAYRLEARLDGTFFGLLGPAFGRFSPDSSPPPITASVRMSGLDAVRESVVASGLDKEGRASLLFAAAAGYAKPGAPGELLWDFVLKGTGRGEEITVNGKPLPK